jgi:hypothetical protein
MKTKITLLIAVACMISTASFAQAKFGANAGTNFSNVRYHGAGETNESTSKVGLNFGLFADFEISDKFSVQPELNFSQLGAKWSEAGFGDYTETFNTIAIPLLAKFHIADLSLMAGPQLAFVTSANAKTMEVGEPVVKESIKNYYKGSIFSLAFGAEYGIGDKLVAGARYQAGLSDIEKVSANGYKTTLSAFTLSIGYKFN